MIKKEVHQRQRTLAGSKALIEVQLKKTMAI
jgi:hypothetical protein